MGGMVDNKNCFCLIYGDKDLMALKKHRHTPHTHNFTFLFVEHIFTSTAISSLAFNRSFNLACRLPYLAMSMIYNFYFVFPVKASRPLAGIVVAVVGHLLTVFQDIRYACIYCSVSVSYHNFYFLLLLRMTLFLLFRFTTFFV